MSTTSTPPRSSGPRSSAPGTSKGTLAASGVAAVAAAAIGFAALQGGAEPQPAQERAKVLVAERAISRGTVLTSLTANGTLRTREVAPGDVRTGALTSVEAVKDQIATADIAPGTQLTAAAVTADAGSVATRLTPGQRALTVPVDTTHGMAGDIAAADRVDVYASVSFSDEAGSQPRPIVRMIAEDVRVLGAPAQPKGSSAAAEMTQVTLSLTPKQAAEVAFTADSGKVWIAARPAGSSQSTAPDVTTLESLLFDVKPVIAVAGAKEAKR